MSTVDELLNEIRDGLMAGDEALDDDEVSALWVRVFIEDDDLDLRETRGLFATILKAEQEYQETRHILADIRELLITYTDTPSAIYRGEIEWRIEQVIGPCLPDEGSPSRE